VLLWNIKVLKTKHKPVEHNTQQVFCAQVLYYKIIFSYSAECWNV